MRLRIAVLLICLGCCAPCASAQRAHSAPPTDAAFGPVVRAYLGYLRAEQEVVDARESRREISPAYYRRNSSRIRALRQMAVRIARETRNDYLPELEAVAGDELNTLFELPPAPSEFRVGEVLDNTFRYLGAVREGETFYLFARLDPYEQADLMQKGTPPVATPRPAAKPPTAAGAPAAATDGAAVSRPRRISPP
jgi:hypothetical protein